MSNFEYEATGKTLDGTVVSESGKLDVRVPLEELPEFLPEKDGPVADFLYSKALKVVIYKFYSSQFKQKGHEGISEVTITLKYIDPQSLS